jgi:hypothetical protein
MKLPGSLLSAELISQSKANRGKILPANHRRRLWQHIKKHRLACKSVFLRGVYRTRTGHLDTASLNCYLIVISCITVF